jgi:hypothetical protein
VDGSELGAGDATALGIGLASTADGEGRLGDWPPATGEELVQAASSRAAAIAPVHLMLM